MRQVVVITGHICTGKSGLARRLREQFGYHRVGTSEYLVSVASERGLPLDRASLQQLGDALDVETTSAWPFKLCRDQCDLVDPEIPVVFDNVRTWEQLEYFRSCRDITLVHVHLFGSQTHLLERFRKKHGAGDYDQLNIIKDEDAIRSFKHDADVRINTDFTDGEDTLVRVAARLGLYPPPDRRCVDVIIGGQYGSEGKGHVAAYLAKEYDYLLRVGGPNAGHTVSGISGVYTYHQLPSGAKETDAVILLGPGMTIDVEKLLQEIEQCEIPVERLFIDPQAIIILPSDLQAEQDLKNRIGSTASGSGSAAARKIMGRGDRNTLLAKDVAKLAPYVGGEPPYRGRTLTKLEQAYKEGCSILFEGTQGSGLSLHHGQYPSVTSRDTNVAGCLAEAGISPARVRRILMVVRPRPIRVADPDRSAGLTSGKLKHETDFQTVAERANLNAIDVLRHEKTSTTKRDRRVGWFEWEQFRQACALNVPTDIVLAFADYLHADNGKARRFEQLTQKTILFVEELERIAQAPVSLINTRFPREEKERFDLRTVIDRRTWNTTRRSSPQSQYQYSGMGSQRTAAGWRNRIRLRATHYASILRTALRRKPTPPPS